MALGLSPKLPLSLSPSDGFALNKTIPEVVKQNLKNLMLTNPGERLMDKDFGIGIKNFLFEPNVSFIKTTLSKRIEGQIKQYMPFVQITNLAIEGNENELYLEISYNINPISFGDRILFTTTTAGSIRTT